MRTQHKSKTKARGGTCASSALKPALDCAADEGWRKVTLLLAEETAEDELKNRLAEERLDQLAERAIIAAKKNRQAQHD